MADRYWVGGNGTWSSTNTTRWSATSGGASGASVPTSLDKVYIDANSGGSGATITIASGYTAVCYSFSRTHNITISSSGSSGALTVGDSSGGLNSGDYIDTSGATVNLFRITILGSTSGTPSVLTVIGTIGQTVQFAMTQGSIKTSGNTFIGSRVDVNGANNLDISGFSFQSRGLVFFGGGALIASSTQIDMTGGSFSISGSTSFDPSSITSLKLTGADFSDDRSTPQTYPSIEFNTGSGNFASYNTPNATMTITALTIKSNGLKVGEGQSLIIGTIDTSGVSAGTAVLTTSSGSTPFTLSSASGTRQLNKLIISKCIATGGATFTADASSVDAGSNSGIQFANSSGFLAFFT